MDETGGAMELNARDEPLACQSKRTPRYGPTSELVWFTRVRESNNGPATLRSSKTFNRKLLEGGRFN